MKKLLLILLLLLVLGGGIVAWLLLGSGTAFSANKEYVYIRSNAANKQAVLDSLKANGIVSSPALFDWVAARMNYWSHIKPGKYEIDKGSSILTIVRILRNGRQTPVNLTINKLRTKEDFARMIGNRFETDSLEMIRFLNSADSLKTYDVDTVTALSLVLPDTYTYFWNSSPQTILKKMAEASNEFWTEERLQKATAHGLSKIEAYTLASIIEEETNKDADKGNIASVYLNRIHKGMPLQADPTIKFAMRNFALKRIYEKYLFVPSPYNTYRNKGLPPGPICTPGKNTLNAVLDAPSTDYLYFVASSKSLGSHDFSVTYEEHMQKARAYQSWLNRQDSIRKASQP
ncbi:MAG TPA: endolytic transglycosylase MltG [Flavisolibacter sp.]|jgi:UPF0755 protein|nr:endolytic transglycosylase MltG [Flavisolibacter sp.]